MKTQIDFDRLIAAGNPIVGEVFDTIVINHPIINHIQIRNCTFNYVTIETDGKITLIDCKFECLYLKNRSDSSEFIKILNCSGLTKDGHDLMLYGFANAAFGNCKINELKLERAAISNILFDGCRIQSVEAPSHGTASLDVFGFVRTSFDSISSLANTKINNDTLFENCIFERLDAASFRKLKKQYSDHGNDIQSDLFGAYELKSKYHNTKFKNDPMNQIIGFLYLVINNFGINAYRPLFFLVLISMFLPLFNDCSNLMMMPKDAFVFLIGPFKFFNEKLRFNDQINMYLSFFLTFISSTLWFFLVIGIRKRFKITH